MVQRDYIERLIQQVVETLALMFRLRERGESDRALRAAEETGDVVLGPDHALLKQMEATTLVNMVGRYELERVRLYAMLVDEEGLTHEATGATELAAQRYRRALELLAATFLGGGRLREGDRERVEVLSQKVDVASLEARYQRAIERIANGDP